MIFILEGTVEVESVESFFKKAEIEGCAITFLNVDYVADKEHAEFAARKAFKSWIDGRSVAKTLSMEVLLYTAATRQIHKAMEIGLKEGKNRVIAVVIGEEFCIDEFKKRIGFREERVLHPAKEKIKRLVKFYEINENEIETTGSEKLSLLVRERIVLFDIFK